MCIIVWKGKNWPTPLFDPVVDIPIVQSFRYLYHTLEKRERYKLEMADVNSSDRGAQCVEKSSV